LNSECWNETKGVRGYDGIAHNLTTVDECRAACFNDYTCASVDWDPHNDQGSCWIFTPNATGAATENEFITHYELRRICLQSQSYFYRALFAFLAYLKNIFCLNDF